MNSREALEAAAKLDSANSLLGNLLAEARARLDRYLAANRLIAEARVLQQQGRLGEAEERLNRAHALDPANAEAVRLGGKVRAPMIARTPVRQYEKQTECRFFGSSSRRCMVRRRL